MSESPPSAGRVIRFELDKPLPSLNRRDVTNRFDRERQKAALSFDIKLKVLGQIPREPFVRSRITVERRSTGELDMDNLWASVKPLFDVLQPPTLIKPKGGQDKPTRLKVMHKHGLGIITEDNNKHLEPRVFQTRVGRRAEQKTIVTIEELI